MKGNAKHILKGYVLGLLTVALLCSVTAFAVGRTTWKDVAVGGISIVVDGKKINPKDGNGNAVEPIIYNGTTYLPVRAVADALGKAVYWDGPNYTVYLGEMSGKLEYPSAELISMKDVNGYTYKSNQLVDNYGNNYATACYISTTSFPAKYILDMKYTKFKGVVYVPEDSRIENAHISIMADGKTLFTTPQMESTSRPVEFDLNVTGCNILTISYDYSYHSGGGQLHLGDAGFYQ